MEWLSLNWFQLITLLSVVLSWAVHYGISMARWTAMSDKVDDMEEKLDVMDKVFQVHITNSEMHVTPTFRQLCSERHEYTKKQFDDTRSDIQQIKNLLTK